MADSIIDDDTALSQQLNHPFIRPTVILGTPIASPVPIPQIPIPQTPLNRDIDLDFDTPIPTQSQTQRKRKRTVNATPTSPEQYLKEARGLIVRAANAEEDFERQTQLLNFLDLFREFTETGVANKDKTVITHLAHIEHAQKKLVEKVQTIKNNTSTIPTKKPYAKAAQTNTTPTSTSTIQKEEWQKVEHTKKPTQKKESNKEQLAKRKLVLIKPTISSSFLPIKIRDKINDAFKAEGNLKLVVATVTKTTTGNIMITTTPDFTAEYLILYERIWENYIEYSHTHLVQPWFKVVLHRIPIEPFNHTEGMEQILKEVKTFNENKRPVGTPYWLTSAEARKSKKEGSVVVAFSTEKEAKQAIQHGLNVAGLNVKVGEYFDVPKTTQCTKCQRFGHLNTYCRYTVACRLCGEGHSTERHSCSICQAKGKRCPHLIPKCINCKEAHTANTTACEVYQAISTKRTGGVEEN